MAVLSIRLNVTNDRLPVASYEIQQEALASDDVVGILAHICDVLADSSAVDFSMSGFGQSQWPVDVRTDLLTVVGQVPGALRTIRSQWRDNSPVSIDLYEQGLERTLTFVKHGQTVETHCDSRTKWQPNPAVEIVSLDYLKDMLTTLLSTYVTCANRVIPQVAENAMFMDWLGIADF